MRESIGSTWILQLVIVFILLFVSFLTLSLSYSKSYKTKNEMLSIIEKYEGLTSNSVKLINNYLDYNAYNAKGKCPDSTWYGQTNISASNGVLEPAATNEKYYYCVKKRFANKNYYFYEVKVFLSFNLPALGNFATFTISGSTADVLSTDAYTAYN